MTPGWCECECGEAGLGGQGCSWVNGRWITEVSAEARWTDAADTCIENWDLSPNPTSCPPPPSAGKQTCPPAEWGCPTSVDMPENPYGTNKS